MENLQTVINHYGSQAALAQAWDVSEAAVSQWVAAERLPVERLVRIYALTKGALTLEARGKNLVIVENR